MSLGKFLLRLIAPRAERERMQMRHARSCVQAHAEDLNRTISLRRDDIVQMLADQQPKHNGYKNDHDKR